MLPGPDSRVFLCECVHVRVCVCVCMHTGVCVRVCVLMHAALLGQGCGETMGSNTESRATGFWLIHHVVTFKPRGVVGDLIKGCWRVKQAQAG